MRKIIILIFVLLVTTACTKRYTYVEIVRKHQLYGGTRVAAKEEIVIRAKSDTTAYLEAYEKYCISLAVYYGMKERYGMSDLLDCPIGFRLYDSDNIDITDIQFASKSEQKQQIEERVIRAGVETFY